MAKIDPTARILWLSDIHFCADMYKSEDVLLNTFLTQFDNYLVSLEKKNHYDYILLSGDIAQTGSDSDYKNFHENIFKKLKNTFKNAMLLVTPGNHDVNQIDISYIDDFLEILPRKNRKNFFSSNRDKFDKTFKNYSDFFEKSDWNKKTENSNLRDNSYLYGYHVDLEKKILFILLNSSWYSVGDKGFLKKYLIQVLSERSIYISDSILSIDDDKDYGSKEIIEILNESANGFDKRELNKILRNISNITNEYGNQELCLSEIKEIKVMSDIISKYKDFVIITSMHHPINWFSWSDRNNCEDFNMIKRNTDILLTGHEHVPLNLNPQYIENKSLLHIQAGCFMNYPNGKDFYIDENWFSTLKINTKKRSLVQTKHFFNNKSKDWEKFGTKNYLSLNKKFKSKLSLSRFEQIKTNFSVEKFVKNKYSINSLKSNCFIDNDVINYVITDGIINQTYSEKILKHKEVNNCKHKRVNFILFDIFHSLFDYYLKEKDKIAVLHEIKSDLDFKFDEFRHFFFSNVDSKTALKLRNLELTCEIIPYWEVEKYL